MNNRPRILGEKFRPVRWTQENTEGTVNLTRAYDVPGDIVAPSRRFYYGVVDSALFETLLITANHASGGGDRIQYTQVSGQMTLTLDLRSLLSLAPEEAEGALIVEPVLVGITGASAANLAPEDASILRQHAGVTTVLPRSNSGTPQGGFNVPGHVVDLSTVYSDPSLSLSLPTLGNGLNHVFCQSVLYRVMLTLVVQGEDLPERFAVPFKTATALFAGGPVMPP